MEAGARVTFNLWLMNGRVRVGLVLDRARVSVISN